MDKKDEPKENVSKYNRKKGNIEIEVTDPIYDVMDKDELDEANNRFMSLLEDDNTNTHGS